MREFERVMPEVPERVGAPAAGRDGYSTEPEMIFGLRRLTGARECGLVSGGPVEHLGVLLDAYERGAITATELWERSELDQALIDAYGRQVRERLKDVVVGCPDSWWAHMARLPLGRRALANFFAELLTRFDSGEISREDLAVHALAGVYSSGDVRWDVAYLEALVEDYERALLSRSMLCERVALRLADVLSGERLSSSRSRYIAT